MVLPLGLMVPGPSVETKEVGQGEVGTVRLIKSERVPSCCGVMLELKYRGARVLYGGARKNVRARFRGNGC